MSNEPTIHDDGQQAVEERLQSLVSGRYYLVKHDDQQVGVGSRKHGDIHRDAGSVGLVEADPEIALAAQQEQDEHSNVHQTNSRLKAENQSQLVLRPHNRECVLLGQVPK